MKITITIELSALDQTSPAAIFPLPPATAQSSRCAADSESLKPQASPQVDPHPSVAGTLWQTLDAAELEQSFREIARKASALGWKGSQITPAPISESEYQYIQEEVLKALNRRESQEAGQASPPPPAGSVGSSSSAQPDPSNFRYKAPIESFFRAILKANAQ